MYLENPGYDYEFKNEYKILFGRISTLFQSPLQIN